MPAAPETPAVLIGAAGTAKVYARPRIVPELVLSATDGAGKPLVQRNEIAVVGAAVAGPRRPPAAVGRLRLALGLRRDGGRGGRRDGR